MSQFESYLGLPTLIGREKYHTFSFIKDRVWKKLQGWKGMMLSRAGKEVGSCSVYSNVYNECVSASREIM